MLQTTYEIAEGKIFILGDFNMLADLAMDRLGAPPGAPVPLVGWLSTYRFRDVWCFQHPDIKEYSCYSETHTSLSRIDTVLAEGEGLELVREIVYFPRALSDHSPITLDLNLGAKPGIHHWRMQAIWVQEEYVKMKCTQAINLVWVENGATESTHLQWEAFKATLRGLFMSEGSEFK